MPELTRVKEPDVDRVFHQLNSEAEEGGYHLNPDEEFTKNLVRGLLRNEQRYGYRSCPCRLASGKQDEDLDIVCPCDYRDPDLSDFGACYCALYVNDAIIRSEKKVSPVPERRPPRSMRSLQKTTRTASLSPIAPLPYHVWRCRVCGYLCAREQPPDLCPICKAKKDRFERFM